MTLDQGSSSTTLYLSALVPFDVAYKYFLTPAASWVELDGVPTGKEDETERNLDVYYIRSLKVSRVSMSPDRNETASDL
jgi:hypothetical protein